MQCPPVWLLLMSFTFDEDFGRKQQLTARTALFSAS
jgi:hypothetical protein